MIKALNVGEAWPGISLATIGSAGNPLFLTGHCPTDANGDVIAGDFEQQVTATFENLKVTLEAAGVGFEAVAKLNVFLTEINGDVLATFKKVRAKFVNMAAPPAFTVLAVAALWDPKIKIEIDGIAIIPNT
ncbi:RidA family protein [Pseudomonas putida]